MSPALTSSVSELIPAGSAHAAVLAAIHAAAFPPGEAWGADAMVLQLGLPGCFGLLHPEGAGLVLARVVATEAEVLTLAVLPAARRAGVGRALLRAAVAMAAARGAVELFLEVAADNGAARALYDAAGMRAVGLRRRYYPGGRDAVVLRLELSKEALLF